VRGGGGGVPLIPLSAKGREFVDTVGRQGGGELGDAGAIRGAGGRPALSAGLIWGAALCWRRGEAGAEGARNRGGGGREGEGRQAGRGDGVSRGLGRRGGVGERGGLLGWVSLVCEAADGGLGDSDRCLIGSDAGVCLSECAVGKAEVVGDGGEFGPEGLEYFVPGDAEMRGRYWRRRRLRCPVSAISVDGGFRGGPGGSGAADEWSELLAAQGGGEGVLSGPVRRRFERVAGLLESRDGLVASLDVRPDSLSHCVAAAGPRKAGGGSGPLELALKRSGLSLRRIVLNSSIAEFRFEVGDFGAVIDAGVPGGVLTSSFAGMISAGTGAAFGGYDFDGAADGVIHARREVQVYERVRRGKQPPRQVDPPLVRTNKERSPTAKAGWVVTCILFVRPDKERSPSAKAGWVVTCVLF
jgi:hypothetical protein